MDYPTRQSPAQVNSLIQAFRELEPRIARKQALAALVNELTSHEWRHLEHIVSARTFQFDIIGSLPAELVIEVFSYLDIAAVYRLQVVSRRWNHALRNPDVVNQKLKAWYGKTLPTSVNPGEDDYVVRQRQAEHIFRICTGRPYNSLSIPIPWHPSTVVVVGDHFAWLNRDCRVLNVFNLRTGKIWQKQSPARERFYGLKASDELIVFCTYKSCYASTLSGDESKNFRLLKPEPASITCRGRTVAYGSALDTDSILIYIWDYDSGQGRSFEIPYTEQPFAKFSPHNHNKTFPEFAILPDPKTQTIRVFYIEPAPRHSDGSTHNTINGGHTGTTIHYTRFSFNGERLQDYMHSISGLYGCWVGGFYPVDWERFALEAFIFPIPKGILFGRFEFDEHSDRFKDLDLPRTIVQSSPIESHSWSPLGVYWWKDTYYQVLEAEETNGREPRIAVCLGTSSEPTLGRSDEWIKGQNPKVFKETSNQTRSQMLINENFVVLLPTSGDEYLTIHSFDSDVTLSEEILQALHTALLRDWEVHDGRPNFV